MANQFVKSSIEDGIAVVTIDRPPVNALNSQTVDELDATIAELEGNDEARVIIITGGGQRAFVAGADINELLQNAGSPETAKAFLKKGQRTFDKIEALGKPVIAAIDGFCLGGGNELAMSCHIRVATERSSFGQPEINLGIIPGFGGTQRTPRLANRGTAIEMMLTGEAVSAAEALRIGLVDHVVAANAVDAAKEIAKKIAAKSRVAVAATLATIYEGLKTSLAGGLDIEADGFAKTIQSEDAREGLKAFLERRQPKFQDK